MYAENNVGKIILFMWYQFREKINGNDSSNNDGVECFYNNTTNSLVKFVGGYF